MHAKTVHRLTGSIVASLAVAAGVLVAGCGDDDKSKDAAAPKQPAAPASFAIEATAESKKKKALEFPATVKAGLVTMTLKNSDSGPRSAQIVRIVGDHTIDDVLKVTSSDSEGRPIPSWIQDGGGVTAVKPGATASVTQVLAPGKYGIWDDEGGEEGGDEGSPSNDELGAKGEFTVTGPAVDAELPAQPVTVTATDDGKEEYGFEFKGLKAGTNLVRFENTGKELHHALFFPLRKGATIKDAIAAFASEEEPKGPPPVDFENGVGTTVIDGGIAQNIELDLKAARYAVICFIQDRKGGKPHVAEGMIDELTVE